MESAECAGLDYASIARSSHDKRRVVNIQNAQNVEILHSDVYTATIFAVPRSLQNVSSYCPFISGPDGRGFRFCDVLRAQSWQNGSRRMAMHVIMQRCAFFDRGRQWMGGTFDRNSFIVAAHINSVPRFHGQNLQKHEELGMGLSPYSCEAQAHFWRTAQYVLTLLDVIPSSSPVVVCANRHLTVLWDSLSIERSRLLPFDSSATYFARRLYSVVPSPYGPHGRDGGEPCSRQSFTRLQSHLLAAFRAPTQRDIILLISRGDRGTRRCSTQLALLSALRRVFEPAFQVVEFVGTHRQLANINSRTERLVDQANNARAFRRARLIVGPHGGAFMNLVYAQPRTPVIEIGYYDISRRRGMPFPPYYMLAAHGFGLQYWLVLSKGTYTGTIACDVNLVVQTARVALNMQ